VGGEVRAPAGPDELEGGRVRGVSGGIRRRGRAEVRGGRSDGRFEDREMA